MIPNYSMLIEWSDEDHAYVVSFREFPGSHTHGETYLEAVENGQTVLALLIETYESEDKPLPEPIRYQPVSA